MYKSCPLARMGFLANSKTFTEKEIKEIGISEVIVCLKEYCGWYNEDSQKCAILTSSQQET